LSLKKQKPKLTDAERHKRFVEMAREIGASDDPKNFDQAFTKVVRIKGRPSRPSQRPKDAGGNRPKAK
jgi:hypothetical protein